MSESSEVYSTKQIADSLGLGAAMVRKYAVALEKLIDKDVPIKRRDGRQFSREHFDTISKAKALVDSNNGLSVETALKMALSQDVPGSKMARAVLTPNSEGLHAQELIAAFKASQEPVIAELRLLRRELRELQEARLIETEAAAQVKQLDDLQVAVQRTAQSDKHGLLVRIALQLEQWLGHRKE